MALTIGNVVGAIATWTATAMIIGTAIVVLV